MTICGNQKYSHLESILSDGEIVLFNGLLDEHAPGPFYLWRERQMLTHPQVLIAAEYEFIDSIGHKMYLLEEASNLDLEIVSDGDSTIGTIYQGLW